MRHLVHDTPEQSLLNRYIDTRSKTTSLTYSTISCSADLSTMPSASAEALVNKRAKKRKQSADVEVKQVQPQCPVTVSMPLNHTLSPLTSSSASSSPASSFSFESTPKSAILPASSSSFPTQSGKKRSKSGSRTLSCEEIDELLISDKWDVIHNEDDDEETDMHSYDSCNEVRRKIRAFIRSGRMNQTRFMKVLNVNPGSWHNYMRLLQRCWLSLR